MEHMKNIQQRLASELQAMNHIIVTSLHTSNEMMDGIVMRYLKVKGKQIRPMLGLSLIHISEPTRP